LQIEDFFMTLQNINKHSSSIESDPIKSPSSCQLESKKHLNDVKYKVLLFMKQILFHQDERHRAAPSGTERHPVEKWLTSYGKAILTISFPR
jgi:hypothetical protein